MKGLKIMAWDKLAYNRDWRRYRREREPEFKEVERASRKRWAQNQAALTKLWKAFAVKHFREFEAFKREVNEGSTPFAPPVPIRVAPVPVPPINAPVDVAKLLGVEEVRPRNFGPPIGSQFHWSQNYR
jgi:hypothetical protein